MKYSASTNGIYRDGIKYKDMPADAVLLSKEQVADIEEAISKGMRLVPSENGFPTICRQPSLSDDELMQIQLNKKTEELRFASDQIYPLQYLESQQQLTEQEVVRLRNLREFSVDISRIEQQEGWPHNVEWPVRPT
ncbi:TPA: tail fiber assembly protein [Aeromonas dhakensis]|nr:tail fiber assembly protein [Aeromonas dhakensis]